MVADEVRILASRSAEAAKNTTELIETSISEVVNGVKYANQTAEILKGFVESINKVTDFVGEISAASQEQVTGVAEINNGLSQLNNVVQQNFSIFEESASATQELSSQSDFLVNLMNGFKLAKQVEAKDTTITKSRPASIPSKPIFRSEANVPTKPAIPFEFPNAAKTTQIPFDGNKRKIVLDDDFAKY